MVLGFAVVEWLHIMIYLVENRYKLALILNIVNKLLVGFTIFHFPLVSSTVAVSRGNLEARLLPWRIRNTSCLCTNWAVGCPSCCAWWSPNWQCTCFHSRSFEFQMMGEKEGCKKHLQTMDGGHKCRNLATRKSLSKRAHVPIHTHTLTHTHTHTHARTHAHTHTHTHKHTHRYRECGEGLPLEKIKPFTLTLFYSCLCLTSYFKTLGYFLLTQRWI